MFCFCESHFFMTQIKPLSLQSVIFWLDDKDANMLHDLINVEFSGIFWNILRLMVEDHKIFKSNSFRNFIIKAIYGYKNKEYHNSVCMSSKTCCMLE